MPQKDDVFLRTPCFFCAPAAAPCVTMMNIAVLANENPAGLMLAARLACSLSGAHVRLLAFARAHTRARALCHPSTLLADADVRHRSACRLAAGSPSCSKPTSASRRKTAMARWCASTRQCCGAAAMLGATARSPHRHRLGRCGCAIGRTRHRLGTRCPSARLLCSAPRPQTRRRWRCGWWRWRPTTPSSSLCSRACTTFVCLLGRARMR